MPTPSSPAPTLSAEQLSSLSHFSSLLHLLHHRSSRQHRHSIWYRHFSTFRRHLSSLLDLYTTLASPSATHTTRLTFPAIKTRIAQTLELWQEILVPKWSWVFGQVVAEGRFAVLGVVLVGVLAGVCGVVGVSAKLEALGQAEVERVLEEFAKEGWEGYEESGGLALRAERGGEDVGAALERGGEDVGIALERNGDEGAGVDVKTSVDEGEFLNRGVESVIPAEQAGKIEAGLPPESAEKLRKRPATDSKPKSTKKKRKKNGNAIDDIFG